MIRTDKRLQLCRAMITALLIFIWGNSLMPGHVSQAISDWLAGILLGTRSIGGEMAAGSGILRKLAHFTEFAALGMCLAWLCGMLGRGKWSPFFRGVLAAAADETIQCFVPERGPGIKDVCIDAAGVLAGIILLRMGHDYFKKRSIKFNLEDK